MASADRGHGPPDSGASVEERVAAPDLIAPASAPAASAAPKLTHKTDPIVDIDDQADKISRASIPSFDPTPGFAVIDGDINGTGYNETKVDIIAVPVPGADPIETWARSTLPDGYFEAIATMRAELNEQPTKKELAQTTILSPALHGKLPKATNWIRQGIRNEESKARVLLYRHRELSADDVTLEDLADDLLSQVWQIRDIDKPRPLFFIAHSIGGLVVKAALLKAARDVNFRPILYDCHGITFFATPHRGSSYLSMDNLAESIQDILGLQRPLPWSLRRELRVGNRMLKDLHTEFSSLSSELRLWTFYETVETLLSGPSAGAPAQKQRAQNRRPNRHLRYQKQQQRSEVQFSAPLASIKSSLVDVRWEQVFALEMNHANCASFGPNNSHLMRSYLRDLGQAVRRAVYLSETYVHQPLRLPDRVKVEIVGFYEDPETAADFLNGNSDLRLYFTKLQLSEFLDKGPEQCLSERLKSAAPGQADYGQRPAVSTSESGNGGQGGSGGLNILTKFFKSTGSGSGSKHSDPNTAAAHPWRPWPTSRPESASDTPNIFVEPATARPSIAQGATASNSMPVEAMSRVHELRVPEHSSPGGNSSAGTSRRHRPSSGADSVQSLSAMSDPTGLDFSPTRTSRRGRGDDYALEFEDDDERYHLPSSGGKGVDNAATAKVDSLARGSIFQDPAAGFSRPDPSRRKFMWIHTPFTNPSWVKDVMSRLSDSHNGQDFERLFSKEHWTSRHVQGRRSQAQPSFVKPACSFLPAQPQGGQSPHPSPSLSARSTSNLLSNCFYLYLPYLHFDTYVSMIRRRNLIAERTKHGRARPVPKRIADMESLEARVIWQYLEYDPPLNFRRTLDQYGYPSLSDTSARDDDQMLYKLTKEDGPRDGSFGMWSFEGDTGAGAGWRRKYERVDTFGTLKTPVSQDPLSSSVSDPKMLASMVEEEDEQTTSADESELGETIKDDNLLMVDQLWLWAIDTTTLATFFSKRESQPTEGPLFQQADLRNSVYNELNGDLTGRCENALDLAAFIALHAITVLLDRSSHPDLEVFRIFEEAISMLTERMTSSFRRFRMQTFREILLDGSEDEDPMDKRTSAIKRRHKQELQQAERENRENTSALLELRDLEDELMTLLKLFDTQKNVIASMRRAYLAPDLKAHTHHGVAFLDEALGKLDEYEATTREMVKRVETTRNDYEKLLEMVQRQAQVDEVRLSRLQTELASSQNLSVLIFTIFTVVFLPLSFFTGLFGMNTAEWSDAGGQYLPLGTIGAIALPTSAFLVAASLIAAFSGRVQAVISVVFRAGKKLVLGVVELLEGLVPRAVRQRRQRRRRRRRRDGRSPERVAARKKRERAYDFWSAVRRQRETFYQHQIPALNRK